MAKEGLNLGYRVPCAVQLHGHKMPDGMKAELRNSRTSAKNLNKVERIRNTENL